MARKASRRTARKMRGGYYSFNGAVGVGAPSYGRAEEVPLAGGRRKKSKKSKKTRRRKMRGGSHYGAVSGSYTGTGERGLANITAVNAKSDSGPAALGAFNDGGAKPGSSF